MRARRAGIALGLVVAVGCLGRPAYAQPHGISRAFIGPTAETLPRGEAYLGVYSLMLPFVQVGVTDRLTIGAGSPVPIVVIGGFSRGLPYVATAKARLFHDPQTTVSAGLIHMGILGDGGGGGYAYIVGTRHIEGGTVSVGGGCLYGSGGERSCRPVLTVNAIGRVNERVSVLTEIFALPGDAVMAIGGVRLGGDTFATDLGLGVLIGGGLLPVAAVNMSYRFGRR